MTTTQQPPAGPIDFTLMYLTHEAFRRDLARLQDAADSGRTATPALRDGWANFQRQLEVHHTVEDAALWPRVAAATAGDAGAAALLADMEAEHAALDPLLAAVDRAIQDQSPALPDQVAELAAGLGGHMAHEENSALPLIQRVLTVKDWDAFRRAMARRQGPSGAAAYVPWMLHGCTPDERRRFLAQMPKPVSVLNRLLWEPRYRRRHPWG